MISIITTAYKNTEYIEEAIDSIIESSIGFEFELLVGIDNCVETLGKCIFLQKKYKDNIKFLYFTEHSGTYAIRNTLAKESNYDNLLFIDSDDVMHKDLVKNVINTLDKKEHVRYRYITFHNTLTKDVVEGNKIQNHFHTGTFGIRRSVFLNQNGFEPWICAADGEFYWRIIENGVVSTDLNIVGLYYRRHNNNLTGRKDTSMNSPLRKQYHKLKDEKIQTKKHQPLEKLSIGKFIKINDINIDEYISKSQEKIELSIIIPTYNNLEFLDECINSVLASKKNYKIEILIGIDGCVDTLNYIKNSIYPEQIKLLYFDTNEGPYTIKNTLTTIAKSNKLLFFDSDDIMNENMIDEIVKGLDRYICVKPKFTEFNGKSLDGAKFGEGVFGIKKDIFLSMNGFEPWMMAADSDFMGRLYKRKVSILHTKSPLFKRRVHPNSLTNRKDTGLHSLERHRYAKLSKNKKGDGNPPILHTRPHIILDLEINILTLEQEKKEWENRKKILNTVLNPQPRKIITRETKKTAPITNHNRLDFLTQKVKKKESITHNNQPSDRQELINKKKSNNVKMVKKHFPKKPDNREGKNMINLGGIGPS